MSSSLPTAPQLTVDLLEQLAERWRRQRAPITEALSPGLDEEEMDALIAPLGLSLPVEARVWWGWHDGVAAKHAHGAATVVGTGWW